MRHELYVYFKLPADAATPALRQALRDWQRARCAAWPGLAARLRERPAPTGEAQRPRTWMEVYVLPAGASADDPQAAVLAQGAPVLLDAGAPARHVEHFIAPLDDD